MSAPPTHLPSWPGSTRPPIRRASARRKTESRGAAEFAEQGSDLPRSPRLRVPKILFAPADAGAMGSRDEPGHDECLCDFNGIKFFFQTIFPLQNSFLYWSNDLDSVHSPHLSRHRGGARACADALAEKRESRNTEKFDKQFYCGRVKHS